MNNTGTNTIITQDQMLSYANLPIFASLTEEQKKEKVKVMVEAVLEKVFERIASVLTEKDLQTIDEIDAGDTPEGTALRYFLVSKVPNFEAIMKEEIEAYSGSQKTT